MIDDAIFAVLKARPQIKRYLSPSVLAFWQDGAYKTYAYYNRSIVALVGTLFTDKISADEFTKKMTTLIDNQLFAAWREGMVENGLDPKKDFTQDMADEISKIVASEDDALRGFANDIIAARGGSADAILARAGLWSNRYNDVVTQAKLYTAPKGAMFEWIYGDTEHCDTCAALNGVVASAENWDKSGYKPQNPPNEKLDCGGWRCRCVLSPTDKEATKGGIP